MNENWDLRLGYAYDQAPEPDNTIDYILPDNDRNMFSIGAGYHRNNWALDFSYTLMIISDTRCGGEAGRRYPHQHTERRYGSPDRLQLHLQVLNKWFKENPEKSGFSFEPAKG